MSDSRTIIICYIAIGEYKHFWDGFYTSTEKHFLPKIKKNYLIFSDDTSFFKISDGIQVVKVCNQGWPYNTLLRFKFFDSVSEIIEKFDYAIYLNANTIFEAEVTKDLLDFEEDFILVQHYKNNKINALIRPYERRKKSCAYVERGNEPTAYYLGGFILSKSRMFSEMSKILSEKIDKDLSCGVIAKWHDESHLNRYIIDYNVYNMPSVFAIPQNLAVKSLTKIVFIHKELIKPLDELRGLSVNYFVKFYRKIYNQMIKIHNIMIIFFYATIRHKIYQIGKSKIL